MMGSRGCKRASAPSRVVLMRAEGTQGMPGFTPFNDLYAPSRSRSHFAMLSPLQFDVNEAQRETLKNMQARYDKGGFSKTGSIC